MSDHLVLPDNDLWRAVVKGFDDVFKRLIVIERAIADLQRQRSRDASGNHVAEIVDGEEAS
jgi:hypothetical protein